MVETVRCDHCGTFYQMELTATGRIVPHCTLVELHRIRGPRETIAIQASCRTGRAPVQASYLDFDEIEKRIGQYIDMKV